jgi:hypothetical protein
MTPATGETLRRFFDPGILRCRRRRPGGADAGAEAVRTRSGINLARFHEGLSIIHRDRNAACFADPEGAPADLFGNCA